MLRESYFLSIQNVRAFCSLVKPLFLKITIFQTGILLKVTENCRQILSGSYLGLECNFRFSQMAYFGCQVTV